MKLIHGDCQTALAGQDPADSCVTDPPYGLSFMGKKWDYDVPSVETWRAILDAMKPGAFLVAFGGSRTYHRMAVNVEDAGFEIRDQIMWIYGSGFPKSLDIGKAIDKAAGADREVTGNNARPAGWFTSGDGHDITAPATDAAREWDGWGTALKPAHEPIILARKPLEGTVAANVLKHGVGGLNIDASRVAGNSTTTRHNSSSSSYMSGKIGETQPIQDPYITGSDKGRWPANVIHDGSEEVEAGFPGSASRFFYCAKASKSERNAGLEDMEAKERWTDGRKGIADFPKLRDKENRKNHHPTVKPIALMEYLIKLITPPGGTVLDPFMGSGSTAVIASRLGYDFIGVEKDDEYIELARARFTGDAPLFNRELEL